jgi:UDP:flavonoid glycosyltransferase YjiC (YdhE family)
MENGEHPVLILSAAPFSELFARAALVVHHGGVGTCAQALACGVPQVVAPYTFDQPDNAYLLWQLGISNAVDFLNDPVAQIASTVTELLSSESVAGNVRKYKGLTTDATETSANYLLSL